MKTHCRHLLIPQAQKGLKVLIKHRELAALCWSEFRIHTNAHHKLQITHCLLVLQLGEGQGCIYQSISQFFKFTCDNYCSSQAKTLAKVERITKSSSCITCLTMTIFVHIKLHCITMYFTTERNEGCKGMLTYILFN